MIRVQQLCKSFTNRHVFRDISFSVQQKEILCILGPSGCGKTSLLRILAGVDEATTGTIVKDTNHCGFLFQDHLLLPWCTVRENMMLGLLLQGASTSLAGERIQRYLHRLSLSDAMHLYPFQISGGMKRRVALGQVLSPHPSLLLLDEPLTGLDVITRRLVAEVLRSYADESCAATVVVTHSIEEAIFLADRIIVLSSLPAHVAADIMVSCKKDQALFDLIVEIFKNASDPL